MGLGVSHNIHKNHTMNRKYVPRLDNAIYLNGTDDYLDCGDHDDFTMATAPGADNDLPFAWSMWMKANGTQSQMGLISKSGAAATTETEYRGFMVNGKIYCDINTNTTGNYKRVYTSTATGYNDGKWHHYAFTFNGDHTTPDNDDNTQRYGMTIWFDGVKQVIYTAGGGTYDGPNNETSSLIWGWLMSDPNYDTAGWFADLTLWKNYELTQENVRYLHAVQPTDEYSVNPSVSACSGLYSIEAAEACVLWIPCTQTNEIQAEVDRTPTTTYVCAERPPATPGTIQGVAGTVVEIDEENPDFEVLCAACIDAGLACYEVYDPDGGGTYQPAIHDTNDLETTPNQQNATLTNDVSLQTGNALYNPTSTGIPND